MKRILRPFEIFFRHESAGGIALFLTAVLAMIWANSGFSSLYGDLFNIHLTVGIGRFSLNESLRMWINDGLMAVFFFAVGLEIKRELTEGELNTARKAALPVAGALGGMLFPALIYIVLNLQTGDISGWAVPMATDIAFAMAIMRVLGPRIPRSAVVFLTALAIVDDLGAVIVIAIVFSGKLNLAALIAGAGLAAVLFALNRLRVSELHVYVIAGIGLWIAFFNAGIHPTIAGVILGLSIPLRHRKPHRESPLQKAEKTLLPWVNFLIMPVFALANAGIKTDPQLLGSLFSEPLALGIVAGLLFGKQLGITLFSFIAVKSKVAALPRGAGWKDIYGAAITGGIGFTMSIFLADLAVSDNQLSLAKLAIIAGSLLSGTVGVLFISLMSKKGQAERKVEA